MKKSQIAVLAIALVVALATVLVGGVVAGSILARNEAGGGTDTGETTGTDPSWYDGEGSNWIEVHFEGVPEDAETRFYFGEEGGALSEYTAYGQVYNFTELDPGSYQLDFAESFAQGQLYCPVDENPGQPFITDGGQVVVEYVPADGEECVDDDE
jgi:hypothetical protein